MSPEKTPYHLLDFVFLAGMADKMQEGASRPGRVPHGWLDLKPDDNTLDEYFSAALRHLVAGVADMSAEHMAAAGCNVMILHNMLLRREREREREVGK